ncbi:LCP family protein [Solibacillus sp. CAU 1738]|uniref:LCP family glycopolymer transferase n=1 Tax=Solibacillus sp. CAU 1738 TaxID=3140363 RepID=UPI003260A0C6
MNNNLKLTRSRRKSKSKWKKIVLTILTLFLFSIISYGAYTYYSFQKAIDKMNTPEQSDNNTVTNIPEKSPHIDPFSVLLLGIDEREYDVGRTDTMIVVTVNPDEKTVKMLSIPRDSRVEIIGNNTVEKINHAYPRGGITMTIDTVENLLSIPIDYYVAVNMDGFLQIIDILGGVTVNNDMDLSHLHYTFPKGDIKLNGEEALVFTRIRYEDPRGDFGRQLRQKQLIEAITAKAASPKTILKINDVFEVLGDNVQMNFSANNLFQLQKLYSNLDKNIDQLQFQQGTGGYIGKSWYYTLNEDELEDISNILGRHLDLK